MISSKEQIYIVDDDESVCRALKVLLDTSGFEVRTFSSAEQFFSAVPNSASGCLILDIHLPGINGWQAQQRLLKSGSKRPVIVITVDQEDELAELALKAGLAGFLQKPFHDRALIDTVSVALKSEMGTNKINQIVSV